MARPAAGTARSRSARSRRARSRRRPRRAPWRRPGPAAIRLSLFASASRLPGFERADRRGQAREADDRVEHDVGVGMRGELGEHFGRVEARAGEVAGHAELAGLLGEQLGVVAGGERHDAVVVAVAGDHVEGLGADRTGRSENHDPACHPISLRPEPESCPAAGLQARP